MKLKDLKNLDKDDILGALGLETRRSTTGWLMGVLGTFGVGLVVGAGLGLLLAPKPGRQLREDLRERIGRGKEHLAGTMGSMAERVEEKVDPYLSRG